MRIKSKRIHLADLLSRKDVKEGFDRKPTTIDMSRDNEHRAEITLSNFAQQRATQN